VGAGRSKRVNVVSCISLQLSLVGCPRLLVDTTKLERTVKKAGDRTEANKRPVNSAGIQAERSFHHVRGAASTLERTVLSLETTVVRKRSRGRLQN
jgi:hypothetical protein